MFQRKLEKLEKYLPYFFRDWTITYIYYVSLYSASLTFLFEAYKYDQSEPKETQNFQ